MLSASGLFFTEVSQDPAVCKLVQCSLCGKLFTTKKLIRLHRQLKHPSEVKSSWPCYICGRSYRWVDAKNCNSGLHTFGVMTLWSLKKAISVVFPWPLCKSDSGMLYCHVTALITMMESSTNAGERSGSVVECLTWDRRVATRDWSVAGLSVTAGTGLCPWARHIYPF